MLRPAHRLWTGLTLALLAACSTSEPDDSASATQSSSPSSSSGTATGSETTLATETSASTESSAGDTRTTNDDSDDCDAWEGDATYPGDCGCASPGEECAQGCFLTDGVKTCAQVCMEIGEVCVEDSCDGGTYIAGAYGCPRPGEYGSAVAHPCDQPVPLLTTLEDEPDYAECCCSRGGG